MAHKRRAFSMPKPLRSPNTDINRARQRFVNSSHFFLTSDPFLALGLSKFWWTRFCGTNLGRRRDTEVAFDAGCCDPRRPVLRSLAIPLFPRAPLSRKDHGKRPRERLRQFRSDCGQIVFFILGLLRSSRI